MLDSLYQISAHISSTFFAGETQPDVSVEETTPAELVINPTASSRDPQRLSDDDIAEQNDHKLLIAIAYNVRKLDDQNEKIVTALKQNNRYLRSIHRNMKALLALHDDQLTLNNDD